MHLAPVSAFEHRCGSRYADIIVHRLLAVVTGQDSTYKELLDKRRTQNTCNHINYRHRMAQYSQRASVGLHTHVSPEVYCTAGTAALSTDCQVVNRQ